MSYVAQKQPESIPKVMLVMKQVDGGRAVIGIIECPNCGETHYTTDISCGERRVFCGTGHTYAVKPDGWSKVMVEAII